jgi:hypothetical protein
MFIRVVGAAPLPPSRSGEGEGDGDGGGMSTALALIAPVTDADDNSLATQQVQQARQDGAVRADEEQIDRHAAYGGDFSGSAWLQARHNAATREPLCQFDAGPGGLCRNCHQLQRHDWHRPRTPQLTDGRDVVDAAAVTVVGPGGEGVVMTELAAATVRAHLRPISLLLHGRCTRQQHPWWWGCGAVLCLCVCEPVCDCR